MSRIRTYRLVASLFACMSICCLSQAAKAADTPWKLTFNSRAQTTSGVISPDGRTLAVACSDRTIRLWDLQNGRELRRLVGHQNPAKSLAFSPDSKRLISSAVNGYPHSPIRIWSVATGEQLYEHSERTESAGGVAWHPSGQYFIVGMRNVEPDGRHKSNTTEVFDAATFRHLRRLSTSRAFRLRLSSSQDGTRLILGHGNGYAADVIDMKTGQKKTLGRAMQKAVFSPDSRYIAGIENGAELVILDGTTLKPVRRIGIPPLKNGRPAGVWFKCVQFHPNGRSVFASTERYWIEWNLADGKLMRGGQMAYSGTGQFRISPDGRQLVEISASNRIVVWSLETGRQVAQFHCMDEPGGWAAQTTDGYYHLSDRIQPSFGSAVPRNERTEFSEKMNRPRIVARLLAGMSVEDALALPDDGVPPTISLTVESVGQDAATIQLVARTETPEATIADVEVRVDGRILPLSLTKSLVVSGAATSGESATRTFSSTVAFPPGQNFATVSAVAIDSFGQQSQRTSVRLERPVKVKPVPGRLFVLAVGVSEYENPEFNLQYAHADAKALADKLLQQKGLAFGDVQVQVYTNQKATCTNIKAGLKWLQVSCTATDVAVVLFSGHGITREKGLYYVTHEANLEGVQYTCLNWETIAASLKATAARQILFLADACYAGAFAESDLAPQQDLADSLRRKAGVMVFTSSRGTEKSLERPELGHGVFVAALLEGLEGSADLDGNKRITVAELQQNVTDRVVSLTQGQQHPTLPKLGEFNSELVLATFP